MTLLEAFRGLLLSPLVLSVVVLVMGMSASWAIILRMHRRWLEESRPYVRCYCCVPDDLEQL